MNKFTEKIKTYTSSFGKGGEKPEVPEEKKIAQHAPSAHKPKKKPIIIGGISIREQSLFARRLSFLINAGVPILEGLNIIIDQTTNKTLKSVLGFVADDIAHGHYLHTSLAKFPGVFKGFMINIIRVGEVSGLLSTNLLYLSDELRKQEILKNKIVGALVYPIFITIATLGVTGMITAFIFPKIMPIFSSLNVELPITTIALIAVSSYLREWGILTIIGIIIFVVIVAIVRKASPTFKKFLEHVVLYIPLAGNMIRTYNVANFARTLGILLKSGATVNEALAITGDTLESKIYHDHCYVLVERVKRGEQIGSYLRENKRHFPVMLGHMISIGERTGKLSETLTYLAGLYEEELDDQSKNLSSSIEPILMATMGILVGFVAVSVITPIYGITQSLSR